MGFKERDVANLLSLYGVTGERERVGEPGVARVQEWRPDTEIEAKTPSNMWGGVGRKC
jgi:hypothetical protein